MQTIREHCLLGKDNVQIAEQTGAVTVVRNLFDAHGIGDGVVFRVELVGKIVERSELIFNLLIGDEDGLLVLGDRLAIRRLCLVDVRFEASAGKVRGDS